MFKGFLINLFQNILFKESFLHVMAVLGYLPKLKRVCDELLVHIFSIFFHKNVPYLVLYQLTKFQNQTTAPPQDIK